MIIIYESKTGFTQRYAEMLADQTGMKMYSTKQLSQVNKQENILFLGWMRIGRIQGLKKLQDYRVKAVCGSGTARTAEPSAEAIIERNHLGTTPFFYLRGGSIPLKQMKGFDSIMMRLFVMGLKKRKDSDEQLNEAIDIIEHGFDGVTLENLTPVIEWWKAQSV